MEYYLAMVYVFNPSIQEAEVGDMILHEFKVSLNHIESFRTAATFKTHILIFKNFINAYSVFKSVLSHPLNSISSPISPLFYPLNFISLFLKPLNSCSTDSRYNSIGLFAGQWKQTFQPLPKNHCFPTAKGWDFRNPFPIHARILSDLIIYKSCVCSYKLCEYKDSTYHV